MKFYYVSIFSIFLLGLIYLIGTAVLTTVGVWLRKRWTKAWLVMAPLFLFLYAAPIAEEFWIAWNFGQSCSKDAGTFAYKTVEVDGFYNAVHDTHAGQPTEPAMEDFDKRGYRVYEMRLRRYESGSDKVVHIEKVKERWTTTLLDQPTSRYHYKWSQMDTRISHDVDKIERVVVDSQTGEIMARETKYRRNAPWFFIGLDRPVMLCPGPGEDPLSKFGSVYNLALKPAPH